MYIESERLILQPIKETDFPTCIRWLNDLELTKWMQKPYFQTSNSMYEYYEAMKQPNLWLKIILKSTSTSHDVHIGNISLKDNSANKYYSEISIIIGDKSKHQKGYATEAIKALTDYCFDVRGIHCIQAGAVVENEGCIRAFENAMYKKDAILPKRVYCHGQYRDIAILSKFKEET